MISYVDVYWLVSWLVDSVHVYHVMVGEWVCWVVQTKVMDEAERRQALTMLTQAAVEY